MTTLRIKDVRKVYPNGAEAIKGVSVDVEDGELVVFVGPKVLIQRSRQICKRYRHRVEFSRVSSGGYVGS